MTIKKYDANVQGTKALYGTDESAEDFAARKGAAETDEAFAKRFMKHSIDTAIAAAKAENIEALNALKSQLAAIKPGEDLTALKEEMKKHGLAIESLKENVKAGADRSIAKGSIAETLAKHKDKIEAFKNGTGTFGKSLTIEHKSHQTDTSTDISDRNLNAQWHEAGIVGQLAVRKPFLRNLFKNAAAGTEYIKFTDQVTVTRDAQNVALCATNNSNTKATWDIKTMQITKVRDFIDVCSDMMSDYAFVGSEIQNLVDSSVKLKIDDQLLTGTGVNPQLNSVQSVASAWAANIAGTKDWTSSIQNANVANLIAVMGNQVQDLGKFNKFMPNYVLMNPGDQLAMVMLKNTFGDSARQFPGFTVDAVGNCYINGMLVVTNPNIAANTLYVGDFTKGTVYSIPGVGIEFSYENATNFETETVTVKAYERLNLLVRSVDTNAFMYCNDVTAAINLINKV